MTYKVVVDAGHGYHTPGKRTPDGEREWSFNSKNAEAFIKEIETYEAIEVLRVDNPTGETDVPLKTRTDKANAFGADVYISFHHNALMGIWGEHTGSEVYMYPGSSSTTKKIRELVRKAIVSAYGLYDRGVKEANFHVLRETVMPAILIEGGYMDSTHDIKVLRDECKLSLGGQKVAQAIAKFFSLKKKSTNSMETYVVQEGDTLYGISREFGVSVAVIKEINTLSTDTIYPNQKLIVKNTKAVVTQDPS
ncbi:N-acetylmuramoyl-L-alanine amidase [Priestia aryabhattai]|uniref:N-acetylmuramoyl-L-alanine amidase n=1 Tax=Priestia aryabhattai TaxID=412384 RepID=UPI003D2AB004